MSTVGRTSCNDGVNRFQEILSSNLGAESGCAEKFHVHFSSLSVLNFGEITLNTLRSLFFHVFFNLSLCNKKSLWCCVKIMLRKMRQRHSTRWLNLIKILLKERSVSSCFSSSVTLFVKISYLK